MKNQQALNHFIDNSIEDIDERLAMWSYNLYAFTERWELVLEAKWKLASIAQGQIPTEVKRNG